MKHRRHRRVPARGVAGQVKSNERSLDCAIENISIGGLFLRTTSTMPVGMPVLVELARRGTHALQVAGRVVSVVTADEAARHDTPPGVGIEFDPLPPATERALRALLAELGLRDLAAPSAVDPAALQATASPDATQVVSNVRGLLDMLSDALHQVKERDDEIAFLKAELRRLTAELAATRR